MPPTSDSRAAEANIQDVFLNYVRREKLTVTIRMMDRFSVVLDHAGADYMIFKHAIAAIRTPKAIANYFSPQ
jgi:RNA chaperone Hfq